MASQFNCFIIILISIYEKELQFLNKWALDIHIFEINTNI